MRHNPVRSRRGRSCGPPGRRASTARGRRAAASRSHRPPGRAAGGNRCRGGRAVGHGVRATLRPGDRRWPSPGSAARRRYEQLVDYARARREDRGCAGPQAAELWEQFQRLRGAAGGGAVGAVPAHVARRHRARRAGIRRLAAITLDGRAEPQHGAQGGQHGPAVSTAGRGATAWLAATGSWRSATCRTRAAPPAARSPSRSSPRSSALLAPARRAGPARRLPAGALRQRHDQELRARLASRHGTADRGGRPAGAPRRPAPRRDPARDDHRDPPRQRLRGRPLGRQEPRGAVARARAPVRPRPARGRLPVAGVPNAFPARTTRTVAGGDNARARHQPLGTVAPEQPDGPPRLGSAARPPGDRLGDCSASATRVRPNGCALVWSWRRSAACSATRTSARRSSTPRSSARPCTAARASTRTR